MKEKKMHKCKMGDCDRMIEIEFTYCSLECAIYAGKLSARKVIKEKK